MKRLLFFVCAVLTLSACKKYKDNDGPLPMRETPAGFRGLTATINGETVTAATDTEHVHYYANVIYYQNVDANIDAGTFFNSSSVDNGDQRHCTISYRRQTRNNQRPVRQHLLGIV